MKDKDFPSCFIFFSLPYLCRKWHSEGVSEDIRFLCIKPVRPVANGGFVNGDFDWNFMPEGSMPGLGLSLKSFEELD